MMSSSCQRVKVMITSLRPMRRVMRDLREPVPGPVPIGLGPGFLVRLDHVVDHEQVRAAARQRTAEAHERPHAAARGLEPVLGRSAPLQARVGEHLLVLRRGDDAAHVGAEVLGEVVVVGRHDDVLVRVPAEIPRRQAPGDQFALPVPRRHGEDQELDAATLDFLDDLGDGLVVPRVLVLGPVDVVRVFRVRHGELHKGHEVVAGLHGALLTLQQGELLPGRFLLHRGQFVGQAEPFRPNARLLLRQPRRRHQNLIAVSR
jgi:hypothetical protein